MRGQRFQRILTVVVLYVRVTIVRIVDSNRVVGPSVTSKIRAEETKLRILACTSTSAVAKSTSDQ